MGEEGRRTGKYQGLVLAGGGLYESGIGTAQDIDQAIHWYEEANRKEFKPAQRKLYALGINPYPSLQNEEGRERNAASIPYD